MDNKQIKFKYIFEGNYNPVCCSGTYGGISPNGEIVANFFYERMPIPNSVVHELNDDGTLSGVVALDPENLDNTVIRYVSNGIILNLDSAKAIYKWLGDQIQEIENRTAPQESVE